MMEHQSSDASETGGAVKDEALSVEEVEELAQLVELYAEPFEEHGPRETGKAMRGESISSP